MSQELSDQSELLFRQVPEREFKQINEPSSEAFKPKRKENGKMSLDRGACVTAQQSFERFIGSGFESSGVFGITVGEFLDLNITCYHTPVEGNCAHATADYSSLSGNGQNTAARKLKKIAMNRGQLYPIPD